MIWATLRHQETPGHALGGIVYGSVHIRPSFNRPIVGVKAPLLLRSRNQKRTLVLRFKILPGMPALSTFHVGQRNPAIEPSKRASVGTRTEGRDTRRFSIIRASIN